VKDKTIKDIDKLIDNLQYLKKFINDKISEDDIDFFSKINATHTDIIILGNKLNYKK